MKRAFGFSGSDDDEYDGGYQEENADYRDATVVPLKGQHVQADSEPPRDMAQVQSGSEDDHLRSGEAARRS